MAPWCMMLTTLQKEISKLNVAKTKETSIIASAVFENEPQKIEKILEKNYIRFLWMVGSLVRIVMGKLEWEGALIAETIPVESIGFESSKSDSKKMSSPYEGEPNALADIRQDLITSFLNKGMSQEEAEEQVEFILNL